MKLRSSYSLLLFFIITLLVPFGIEAAGARSVRISTDAFEDKVEVGETFHIIIEAQNCAGKINVPQLPPGVKVVYHTSQSSSRQSVQNGQTISINSTSLIMTCKGEKEGKYQFGPVSVDGVKSNTVSYRIVAASQSKNQKATGNGVAVNVPTLPTNPVFIGKGNEEMFLKAIVNKHSAYEQEAIEYIVKLYTTYGDIKFLGAASAPKFDGFVTEESDDVSSSFVFEDYNGKTYKTAIIARYIIFPQKSGVLKVAGNTYTVSTDAKQYYHDPYFQTMTVKYPVQLNVTPNDVEINVKPLPTPIPEDFIGGVGQFTLTSSMPTRNLTTNTVASLIYTISGSGNVKYLKLPDLQPSLPSSIEVYSPEVTTDVKAGRSNVTGSSRFDFSLLPREAGNFVIPSLTFSYFDPEEGIYKKLHTTQYNVTVSMREGSDKSQQAIAFNPKLMPEGRLVAKISQPYVNTIYYWLWYVVPVVIFIISLGAYRKYMKDHEDLTLLRSKRANKMALRRLSKAYQCIKNHQEEEFYDEMLAALWGYIGDKLKMPTSELNRSNVSEEFKKHGVSETTFMPIINLIDECEYAKYTPVSRDANMRQLYVDALSSLEKVEAEYDKEHNIKQSDDDDEEVSAPENSSYVNSTVKDEGVSTKNNTPQSQISDTDE